MDDLVIGIDLGTTNCCVSLYRNGNTKLLENDSGDRVTPSFVFYTNLGDPTVGKHAKRLAESNPENGIYGINFTKLSLNVIIRNFSSYKSTDR